MESVSIPVALLAGLVSFASPCFLPIVPVFLTYLTGGRARGAGASGASGTSGAAAKPIKALATAGRPGADGFILPSSATVGSGGWSGRGAARPDRWSGRSPGRPTEGSGGVPSAPRPKVDPTPRPVRGPWWGVLNALAFVGAFAAAFMAFWLMVSLVGLSMGDYRGVLRVIGGVVLILLGLVTLGFFQIGGQGQGRGQGRVQGQTQSRRAQSGRSSSRRTPGRRSGPLERINTSGEPTLRRSALMGLAFAVAWSPCIGPVLGVILGLAMMHGTLGSGMVLLAAYCIGLGLPLVVMAAGVGGLRERLSWFSQHQEVISTVSGVLLIVIGFLLVTDLLAPLSNISLGGM